MSNKKIFYTNDKDKVVQVHPSPEYISQFDSEDEAIAAIIAKDIPADKQSSAIIIDKSQVPDRKFRDSWKQESSSVVEDMTKARAIHMDRIRVYRNAELAKEDINYQIAFEQDNNSKKNSVASKKQMLRDIPSTFNLSGATNGTELDALWPSELPARPNEE
jgi:hypothetical protein|tara:strand:- start:735 stop:1217 length:483 start_codon:yes stop_codon:yes gene_type:complete